MLGLSGLVKKFQDRLEVSRENAIWRIIMFIFLSICFVTTLATAVLFFPSRSSFREEIPILSLPLSGIYTQTPAREIHGDVEVDKDKFIEMAKGNQISVYLYGNGIIYTTKVAGLLYCYKQIIAPVDRWYFIHSHRVQDGFVIREIKRNIVRFISSQVLILLVLFLVISRTQTRCVS